MTTPRSLSTTLHANAVLLGEDGVLIEGPSGSGKSWLTGRLMSAWPFGVSRLVADDRTVLSRHGEALVARPHPLIGGQLEWRNHGILRLQSIDAARISAVIRLGARPERMPPSPLQEVTHLGIALPCLMATEAAAVYDLLRVSGPFWRNPAQTLFTCGETALEKDVAARDKKRPKATASSSGPT
jgi:HPr kinase/phosphorylase